MHKGMGNAHLPDGVDRWHPAQWLHRDYSFGEFHSSISNPSQVGLKFLPHLLSILHEECWIADVDLASLLRCHTSPLYSYRQTQTLMPVPFVPYGLSSL